MFTIQNERMTASIMSTYYLIIFTRSDIGPCTFYFLKSNEETTWEHQESRAGMGFLEFNMPVGKDSSITPSKPDRIIVVFGRRSGGGRAQRSGSCLWHARLSMTNMYK